MYFHTKKLHADVCSSTIIFAKIWKQLRCPSVGKSRHLAYPDNELFIAKEMGYQAMEEV
jgi:hypothetical protein